MTALTSMAAAARPPGVSDARVACPLCGGQIHPIAGRCKHCKQDLAAHRGARPQAASPLPALAGTGNAAPVPVPAAESQPILPPRPTGRQITAQPEPRRLWRSWPVYVIILAGIAIVGAVGVMVWPTSSRADKHVLTPPPAPERMDTNPMPPQAPKADNDPWGPPHAQLAPQPQMPSPRRTPDPLPDLKDPWSDDDVLGVDPFATPRGALGGANAAGLAVALGKHMCERIAKCGTSSMMSSLCTAYAQLQALPTPSCPQAKRCLDHVDNLSCTDAADMFSPWEVMQQVQDCVDAMKC